MRNEELAQWYFRLNGFFTIPNFVLHPASRGSQRTDVDVVGIRFPHRREFGTAPGQIDDSVFQQLSAERRFLVLAEVKSRWVGVNAAWLNEAKKNLEAILASLGVFCPEEGAKAAAKLRQTGVYETAQIYCSLFFVGEHRELGYFQAVPHRTWSQIISFIHQRFMDYHRLKTQTDQWDDTGRELLSLVHTQPDAATFARAVRDRFGLPPA